MNPGNLSFGGGAADSAVHPAVLVVVILVCLLICVLPRRAAIAPFLAAAILVPFDQIVVIVGVHFQMVRLLAIFGLARIVWRKLSAQDEVFSGGVNGIDKSVILLSVFALIDGILLWQSTGEFVYQIGNMITALGVYLLLRHLIRCWDDVQKALTALAFVAAVIAVFMVFEYVTGRDLFYASLGGAQAAQYSTSLDRGGAFRARGCFAHPILAGAFAGFVFPLFIGWWQKGMPGKRWAVVGAVSTVVIPFTTGSSTALFALIGSLVGLCFWPVRRSMRAVRWGIVLVLCGLQSVMKSPVWHIISDVSLSADSSSYHRYMLVDQCIRHFSEWALVGTKNFASWGWDMWDLSNQYVATADTSGLIPLLALLAILTFGFRYVGRARRSVSDRREEFFIWAVGASLFSNVVAYFGIVYFDQTIVPWYMVLAILSAMTMTVWSRQTAAATAGATQVELQPAPLKTGFGSKPAFQPAKDARAGAGLQAVGNGSKRGS